MHYQKHNDESKIAMSITKRRQKGLFVDEMSVRDFYALTKDTLYQLYIIDKMSTLKLSNKFCVATNCIKSRLNFFDIPIRSMSAAQRGRKLDVATKEKIKQKHIGLKTSEETKEKHRQYNKEHPPTQEQRDNMGILSRKLFLSKEELDELYNRQQLSTRDIAKIYNVTCSAVSSLLKKYSMLARDKRTSVQLKWETDADFVKRVLKSLNVKPNKLELRIDNILNEKFPKQWEYVGDFSFVIAGKSPDFKHVSDNKLLEIYGDYWHKGDDPQERIDFFEQHGYKTLVFWEHEIKDNIISVLNRIDVFLKE